MNKLIVPPKPNRVTQHETPDAVRACAVLFVGGMSDTQRTRFKQMLQRGLQCGMSASQSYGVPHDEFIAEVKRVI